MDKFINLTKEKETTIQFNKKMVMHLQDIKKKNEIIYDQQKGQKEDYQKRFEEIMRKLEEDYNYDENKCKVVNEENQR